jgi:hypothetical protein
VAWTSLETERNLVPQPGLEPQIIQTIAQSIYQICNPGFRYINTLKIWNTQHEITFRKTAVGVL